MSEAVGRYAMVDVNDTNTPLFSDVVTFIARWPTESHCFFSDGLSYHELSICVVVWRKGMKHMGPDAYHKHQFGTQTTQRKKSNNSSKELCGYKWNYLVLRRAVEEAVTEGLGELTERYEKYQRVKNMIWKWMGTMDDGTSADIEDLPKLKVELLVSEKLVLYRKRILVPGEWRTEVLNRLQTFHQRMETTTWRVRQLRSWFRILKDITNLLTSVANVEIGDRHHSQTQYSWRQYHQGQTRIWQLISLTYKKDTR